MRLPLLLSVLVVPGLACNLEAQPATSGSGTAEKHAARPKPRESTDGGLDSSIKDFLAQPPSPDDVLPFGGNMTRPEKIRGEMPRHTPEALAARVEGSCVLKCIIQLTGEVTDCRILEPVPYMEPAILDAVKTWRFKPATLKGHPVAVSYTFTVNLTLPTEKR